MADERSSSNTIEENAVFLKNKVDKRKHKLNQKVEDTEMENRKTIENKQTREVQFLFQVKGLIPKHFEPIIHYTMVSLFNPTLLCTLHTGLFTAIDLLYATLQNNILILCGCILACSTVKNACRNVPVYGT